MQFFIKLILLAALCTIALAQDPAEESKNFLNKCLEASKRGPEMKKDFEDIGVKGLPVKPETVADTMKCMMKCFMEKMGYFDAGTSDFNATVFKTKLGTVTKVEDLQTAVTACKDFKGVNECDTGYLVMSCMWKNKVMLGSWTYLTGKTTF